MATTIFNVSSAPSVCPRARPEDCYASFRGAHAPRVPAMAPSPSRTLRVSAIASVWQEECFGEAPKPAREARALPKLRAVSLHLGFLTLTIAFGVTSCDRVNTEAPRTDQRKIWEDFSGEKALAHVQAMVDFGPRPPGSEA